MRRGLVAALVASAALLAVPALAQQEYHYVKVATIDLPTPTGHGDWVAYDPSNKMVYVSLKDDGMAVVDTRTNSLFKVIKPIEAPNVMAFDNNYIYETAAEGLPQGQNGGNNSTGFATRNQIVVIDKHTWQIVNRVEMWNGPLNPFGNRGTTPDAIGVANGRIYVDMDDNNVMDVFTAGPHPQFVAQWNLKPLNTNRWWLNTADFTGPDAFAFSPDGRWIYQTVNEVIEKVDAHTGAISNVVDLHTGLTSKGGTKTPQVDPRTGKVWLSTTNTEDRQVMVLDPNTLQAIKQFPGTPGSGTDESALDPGLGLFYTFATSCKGVPNKGGCFNVYDTNKMVHVTTVPTDVHLTHSGTVDPDNHAVYAYEGSRARLGVYCPVPGPGKNGGWAVPMGSAVPCGAGYLASSTYTVYFEFNKSDLTADARRIVNQAAAAAKRGTARIVVDGYTDLAGTAAYNQGLSVRRADAVKAALIADGISPKRISIHGFGKTHPAVPTPDGVREPRNRRAVVVIGPGSMS